MLLRTKKVDEKRLVEMARERIGLYAKADQIFCAIPYLDVLSAKIKYLKFKLVNNNWLLL